jgi:hypothetical protein
MSSKSDYLKLSLPSPTTDLESRLLTVMQAYRLSRGSGHAQWDWMGIVEAVTVGGVYHVNPNTDFYRLNLMNEKTGEQAYRLLDPFIRLSNLGLQRLQEFYDAQRLPPGVPAS